MHFNPHAPPSPFLPPIPPPSSPQPEEGPVPYPDVPQEAPPAYNDNVIKCGGCDVFLHVPAAACAQIRCPYCHHDNDNPTYSKQSQRTLSSLGVVVPEEYLDLLLFDEEFRKERNKGLNFPFGRAAFCCRGFFAAQVILMNLFYLLAGAFQLGRSHRERDQDGDRFQWYGTCWGLVGVFLGICAFFSWFSSLIMLRWTSELSIAAGALDAVAVVVVPVLLTLVFWNVGDCTNTCNVCGMCMDKTVEHIFAVVSDVCCFLACQKRDARKRRRLRAKSERAKRRRENAAERRREREDSNCDCDCGSGYHSNCDCHCYHYGGLHHGGGGGGGCCGEGGCCTPTEWICCQNWNDSVSLTEFERGQDADGCCTQSWGDGACCDCDGDGEACCCECGDCGNCANFLECDFNCKECGGCDCGGCDC